jgi:membrane-associated protease RseP (regulator of RpoE activity)
MSVLRLVAVVLGLAACEAAPPDQLRLVTLAGSGPGGLTGGLSLRELPSPALESIGLAYGLAVVHAGAAAERAGLKVGDVVYGIGRQPVLSLEDFSRRLAEHAGTTIGLLVRRGKKDFYVAMELDDQGAPAPWPGQPARDTLLRT